MTLQYTPLTSGTTYLVPETAVTTHNYFYAVLLTTNNVSSSDIPRTVIRTVRYYENQTEIYWENNTLVVRHNLSTTNISATLTNNRTGQQSLYTPRIIDLDNIAYDFSCHQLPNTGDTLTVTITEIKAFNNNYIINNVDETSVEGNLPGVAIIFRNASLDVLYTLMDTIDEEYWKSLNTSKASKILNQIKNEVKPDLLIVYTSDINNVLSKIDKTVFEVKLAW